MLKLNFKTFQEKLKLDQMNGHYPTIHCLIESDKFTFVIKSKEKWNYYTIVKHEEIIMYAQTQGIESPEAIDMFIINYCSNTIPLEPRMEKDVVEVEQLELDDISKEDQNNSSTNSCRTIPPQLATKQIDAGQDVIIEASDYSDFLLKFFNLLENNVLKAVDKDIDKSFVNKTFGEFLKNLFNTVNTLAFANQVKRYIKIDLQAGLLSAESELGIDIGYTELYKNKLNILASQQIDGYMINGKKWPGIKGVTKEIQADVIKIVQSGINEKAGIEKIKDNITDKFSNFSEWRSEMIARTETTRIINEGKVVGYKESGIEGGKIVLVAFDNRTSDICKRMHKEYGNNPIPIDENFIDPESRKSFRTPPFHVNCRSTIAFRPS